MLTLEVVDDVVGDVGVDDGVTVAVSGADGDASSTAGSVFKNIIFISSNGKGWMFYFQWDVLNS